MTLVLHGKNLIGGTTSSRGEPVVSAVNPSTGGALEPFFFEATAEEVELAMEMAEEAFDDFRHKSAPQIAAFLDSLNGIGAYLRMTSVQIAPTKQVGGTGTVMQLGFQVLQFHLPKVVEEMKGMSNGRS